MAEITDLTDQELETARSELVKKIRDGEEVLENLEISVGKIEKELARRYGPARFSVPDLFSAIRKKLEKEYVEWEKSPADFEQDTEEDNREIKSEHLQEFRGLINQFNRITEALEEFVG